MSTTVVVEFTIEPFIEGEPGRHVTAAITAVESLGITVEVGPFGSSFSSPAAIVGDAVKALLDAAYANGATHVNVHVEQGS
jgi:uncharacterized protein YqgV (UPF0045/DUF77 family)